MARHLNGADVGNLQSDEKDPKMGRFDRKGAELPFCRRFPVGSASADGYGGINPCFAACFGLLHSSAAFGIGLRVGGAHAPPASRMRV
jgi:hypothetical protein